MLPLSIPLPEDAPSIEDFLAPAPGSAASNDADLGVNSVYLETLTQAIESEKGLAIVCGSKNNAIAMRHRLYKVRKKAIAAGNTTLHTLTISIVAGKGTYELHLKKISFDVRPL